MNRAFPENFGNIHNTKIVYLFINLYRIFMLPMDKMVGHLYQVTNLGFFFRDRQCQLSFQHQKLNVCNQIMVKRIAKGYSGYSGLFCFSIICNKDFYVY